MTRYAHSEEILIYWAALNFPTFWGEGWCSCAPGGRRPYNQNTCVNHFPFHYGRRATNGDSWALYTKTVCEQSFAFCNFRICIFRILNVVNLKRSCNAQDLHAIEWTRGAVCKFFRTCSIFKELACSVCVPHFRNTLRRRLEFTKPSTSVESKNLK